MKRLIGTIFLLTLVIAFSVSGATSANSTVIDGVNPCTNDLINAEVFNISIAGSKPANVSMWVQQNNNTGWEMMNSVGVSDLNATTTIGSGNVTLAFNIGEVDGTYTVNVTAYNASDQTGEAYMAGATTTCNLDNLDPSYAQVIPTDGSTIEDETTTFSVLVSEYVSSLTFKWAGNEYAGTANGTDNMWWYFTASTLQLPEETSTLEISTDEIGTDDDPAWFVSNSFTVEYEDDAGIPPPLAERLGFTGGKGTSPIVWLIVAIAIAAVLGVFNGKKK